MKVALSFRAEVRLVTLQWLWLGTCRDDANSAVYYNPYYTREYFKHACRVKGLEMNNSPHGRVRVEARKMEPIML